jgi:dihydroorotate dehydrogenase electron transfer subunit
VTDVLREVIADSSAGTHIVCCGPEPMMHAVAGIAGGAGISCEVSLESPMACGIGICFSCVAKVRDADGGWDYRRTCVEGPVFDAATIEF